LSEPAATTPPTNGNGNGNGKPKSRIGFIVLAVVILIGALFGYRSWAFNQSHASTDDSQVVADSVDLSAQVGATVTRVLVSDNAEVKKGQLLVQLDDRKFQAAVTQAQGNFDAAVAQAQASGVSVNLTRETGNAQVNTARGVVDQAESGVATARSDVSKAAAGVLGAQAGNATAKANTASAQSGVRNAIAQRAKAAAAFTSAQATVASAQAGVRVADAAVATAQANAELAHKEADRYANLLAQGAVSQQDSDAKTTAAHTADAALDGARRQADSARATVAQRQAEAQSAREAVNAANAMVQQSRDSVSATVSQAQASEAAYRQSLAAKGAANDEVTAARARITQAEGQLQQAESVGTQVDVSSANKSQALAKVEQARAALDDAKLQLSYCAIYAPRDGRATKKSVEEGQLVQPGTPLMTIVDENDIWVVANFKETQMPGIEPGKKVDIDVDGVPGHSFHGTVQSIQAGTGSTFTLLPPDNASGNFTKVVQRIPVKVTFDPGQPDLDKLRSGMSTNTVIDL
jgi:membrane fusion protein (multidrug efflux system)